MVIIFHGSSDYVVQWQLSIGCVIRLNRQAMKPPTVIIYQSRKFYIYIYICKFIYIYIFFYLQKLRMVELFTNSKFYAAAEHGMGTQDN